MTIEIRPFDIDDIGAAKKFTDQWIGKNYYSELDLEHVLLFGHLGKSNSASFVAYKDFSSSKGRVKKLVAIRFSYAPGFWIDSSVKGLTPDQWKVHPSKVGHFKSLFVSAEVQKKGIGRELSTRSILALKKMGARAVICHSWLNSPGNSSQIYLKKMGFLPVKEHLLFWHDIDYDCPACSPKKCVCSALEMIKYF